MIFVKTCDELVIELEEQRRLQQQLRQQQQQVEEAQPRPVSLNDLLCLHYSNTLGCAPFSCVILDYMHF